MQQLVDDVNKKMRSKIKYPANDDLHLLMSLLKAQFQDTIPQVIFHTYLQDKKENVTFQKLNHFFAIAIRDDVASHTDRLINPEVKIGVNKVEILEFPKSMLVPLNTTADTAVRFLYKGITATLNYKARELYITFTVHLDQPAQLRGYIKSYDSGKFRLRKAEVKSRAESLVKDLDKVTIILSNKQLLVDGELTTEGRAYRLADQKLN